MLSLGLVVGAVLGCGGSSGGGKGGAGGAAGHIGAGGTGDPGAAAGGGGAAGSGAGVGGGAGGGGAGTGGGAVTGAGGGAGTGGAANHDAGAHDGAAGGGGGSTTACAVAVDGGSVACTTHIVSGNADDIYCALKADGRINCWGSENDDFLFHSTFNTTWPTAVSNAPPNLVQIGVTDTIDDIGYYLLCGVDRSGTGTCWNDRTAAPMGQGLAAVLTSDVGICKLSTAGAISCNANSLVTTPPASGVYARIFPSEYRIGALDVSGTPFYPTRTFPAGTYVDMATNDTSHVAAVRSDGTVVVLDAGGNPVLKPGSFTHVAVDLLGRACAIDAAGEVTCWNIDAGDGGLTLVPPAGPFVAIVGATWTFCAVRATGTTACFGDYPIDVPPGW